MKTISIAIIMLFLSVGLHSQNATSIERDKDWDQDLNYSQAKTFMLRTDIFEGGEIETPDNEVWWTKKILKEYYNLPKDTFSLNLNELPKGIIYKDFLKINKDRLKNLIVGSKLGEYDGFKILENMVAFENLLGESKYKENDEIKEIIAYIKQLTVLDLEKSDYYKMVNSRGKVWSNNHDIYRITFLLQMLSKLSKVEIEDGIFRLLLDNLGSENSSFEYKVGVKCLQLNESDSKEVLKKYISNWYYENLSEGPEKVYNNSLDKKRFFTALILMKKINPLNKSYSKLLDFVQYDIEMFSNNLHRYLSREIYQIDDTYNHTSEKFIDFYTLWFLEKAGIINFKIPKKTDLPVFTSIKSRYPDISNINLKDYKEELWDFSMNNKKNAITSINVNYKFHDCLRYYIESIPYLSRPKFDDEKMEISAWKLFNWYPFIKDKKESVSISLNYLKDSTSNILSEYMTNTMVDDLKFYRDSSNINNLSISEKNILEKENKKRSLESKRMQSLIYYYSGVLPILFSNENAFLDYLEYFNTSYTGFVEKKIYPKLEKDYGPNLGRIYSNLYLVDPSDDFTFTFFQKNASGYMEPGYIKILVNEMQKSNLKYKEYVSNLSTYYYQKPNSILEKFNTKKSDFKKISDYFKYQFDTYGKSKGLNSFYDGTTIYEAGSQMNGPCKLYWNNGNNISIEATIYNGSNPITVKYEGKIMVNSSVKDRNELPYEFITKNNKKFYIQFRESKCTSTIEFEGVGTEKNIYFRFNVLL